MEQTITGQFVELCNAQPDKVALIGRHGATTFGQLLRQIRQSVAMFSACGLKPGDMVLVLTPPSSYSFYLTMLAGIYYGINLVAMDSYKSMNNVRRVVAENRIRYAFCNKKTATLKLLLPTVTFVNMEGFSRYEASAAQWAPETDRTVLTTFTSGTTGNPKPIHRSMEAFREQIAVVSQNMAVEKTAVVFSTLPVYVLFLLFNGLTCVMDPALLPDKLQALGVTAVLAPIAQLLRLEAPLPFVKTVAIGGAVLYPRETRKLLTLFPNADISYIYGSSECVLMAKGDLRTYLETGALQSDIAGVGLCLVNVDSNGVGQICVRGDVVLSETRQYISSDLGRLEGKALSIVGRKEYSEEGRYNYLLDVRLLEENPSVKKGFSVVRDGRVYFCYEGRLTVRRSDVEYIRFGKLPMDAKHRTKLNYKKAIRRLPPTGKPSP